MITDQAKKAVDPLVLVVCVQVSDSEAAGTSGLPEQPLLPTQQTQPDTQQQQTVFQQAQQQPQQDKKGSKAAAGPHTQEPQLRGKLSKKSGKESEDWVFAEDGYNKLPVGELRTNSGTTAVHEEGASQGALAKPQSVHWCVYVCVAFLV